jgi:hypothetical protein
MIDISFTFDPIADITGVAILLILIRWLAFDKKQAKKRSRRPVIPKESK